MLPPGEDWQASSGEEPKMQKNDEESRNKLTYDRNKITKYIDYIAKANLYLFLYMFAT